MNNINTIDQIDLLESIFGEVKQPVKMMIIEVFEIYGEHIKLEGMKFKEAIHYLNDYFENLNLIIEHEAHNDEQLDENPLLEELIVGRDFQTILFEIFTNYRLPSPFEEFDTSEFIKSLPPRTSSSKTYRIIETTDDEGKSDRSGGNKGASTATKSTPTPSKPKKK